MAAVESPLLWLLIAAAAIALATGECSDAGIVLFIVAATSSSRPARGRSAAHAQHGRGLALGRAGDRDRRPFHTSRPGSLLLWSSLLMIAMTPLLPYVPGPAGSGLMLP